MSFFICKSRRQNTNKQKFIDRLNDKLAGQRFQPEQINELMMSAGAIINIESYELDTKAIDDLGYLVWYFPQYKMYVACYLWLDQKEFSAFYIDSFSEYKQ